MSLSQDNAKYIIHSFYFDVDDERHQFDFDSSDYNGDVITNEKIFESIFGYMSKTLNKPMLELEQPEQAILDVDSLIKYLESYHVAISYLFCYGFESQVQHRWFIQKIEQSTKVKDLKSRQMDDFCEMDDFASCEFEKHESDAMEHSISLTKDTIV